MHVSLAGEEGNVRQHTDEPILYCFHSHIYTFCYCLSRSPLWLCRAPVVNSLFEVVCTIWRDTRLMKTSSLFDHNSIRALCSSPFRFLKWVDVSARDHTVASFIVSAVKQSQYSGRQNPLPRSVSPFQWQPKHWLPHPNDCLLLSPILGANKILFSTNSWHFIHINEYIMSITLFALLLGVK